MACKRAATCRARFARGEQACVRCAEGKLDVGDVEDLDDEEDNLDEGELDDIDDDDDEDNDDGDDEEEEDEAGYTSEPNRKFGEIGLLIVINGHPVPGIRVTLTFEDDETEEYVFVVEDKPGDIPDDVHADIDPEVDLYVTSDDSLYGVLEEITGLVIKPK